MITFVPIMEIEQLYQCFLKCTGITTDTRSCTPGTMFFALKGERFDGNAYARQALKAGCSYAVIDDASVVDPHDNRLLLVDNTLQALQQLARHHRRTLATPVIGITGSNGKTTTKELLAAVLTRRFNTLFTQGNLNNSIGVPLTVLRLTHNHELAVVEMGASHPGDIRELVEIAEPDYGIITNVGRAHLEGFGSFEDVIHTKGELYDWLRTKDDAHIFLHADDPCLCAIVQGLTTTRYGSESEDVDIRGKVVSCNPFLVFSWQENGMNDIHIVTTNLVGRYNFENALCAVVVGRYFGMDADTINAALADYQPTNSRSQLIHTEHNTLIMDAYNANPTSMQVAIDNFRCMDAPHKLVILGDMKELGETSDDEHRAIVELLAGCDFDAVWLVGDTFRRNVEAFLASSAKNEIKYRTFTSAEDVITSLTETPISNATVLVKGSNSMHLSTLVPHL